MIRLVVVDGLVVIDPSIRPALEFIPTSHFWLSFQGVFEFDSGQNALQCPLSPLHGLNLTL